MTRCHEDNPYDDLYIFFNVQLSSPSELARNVYRIFKIFLKYLGEEHFEYAIDITLQCKKTIIKVLLFTDLLPLFCNHLFSHYLANYWVLGKKKTYKLYTCFNSVQHFLSCCTQKSSTEGN